MFSIQYIKKIFLPFLENFMKTKIRNFYKQLVKVLKGKSNINKTIKIFQIIFLKNMKSFFFFNLSKVASENKLQEYFIKYWKQVPFNFKKELEELLQPINSRKIIEKICLTNFSKAKCSSKLKNENFSMEFSKMPSDKNSLLKLNNLNNYGKGMRYITMNQIVTINTYNHINFKDLKTDFK